MYSSYHYLRPFAIFAGIFGAIQGLAWMGMAMTGIIAYYCHFNFENHAHQLNSMLDFTFYRLYFQGDCTTPGFPQIDFTELAAVSTMRPVDVHAWMWVYLLISFFWFISSLTLLTNVKMDYIKYANIFLYIWIFFTVAISVLDLAIGILFALDYNSLMHQSHVVNIDTTAITLSHIIMAYAKVAAGIMMAIAFRGWIVWLVNVALALYFFRETFQIYDYNKLQDVSRPGHTNPAFIAEPHSMLKAHPIDAFAFNNNQNNNNNFNNRWNVTSAQDTGRRERARSFSGTPMNDDRVRPVQQEIPQHPQLRRYQAPPPPPPQTREDEVVLRREHAPAMLAREIRDRQSYNENNPNGNRPMYGNDTSLPAPDYSPPPMRGYDNRPPLRSALRNSRYQ